MSNEFENNQINPELNYPNNPYSYPEQSTEQYTQSEQQASDYLKPMSELDNWPDEFEKWPEPDLRQPIPEYNDQPQPGYEQQMPKYDPMQQIYEEQQQFYSDDNYYDNQDYPVPQEYQGSQKYDEGYSDQPYQGYYYQYSPYYPYQLPLKEKVNPPKHKLAIASLVLGISSLAILFFCTFCTCIPISVLPSLIGLIFAFICLCAKNKSGITITGLITNSIAFLLSVGMLIFFIIIAMTSSGQIDSQLGSLYPYM